MTTDNLNTLVKTIKIDMDLFQSNKKLVLGTRIRNNLMQVKKICDSLRKEILAQQKEIKANKTKKVKPDKEVEVDEPEETKTELPEGVESLEMPTLRRTRKTRKV